MADQKRPLSMERVEDLYSWSTAWSSQDPPEGPDLSKVRESLRAEFRTALAAHEREVAASALERFGRALFAEFFDQVHASPADALMISGVRNAAERALRHAEALRDGGIPDA